MSGGSTVIHPDVSLWDAWTPERVGELLKDVEATPLAEVGATLQTHQTWVWEPGTGRWRLDVFREAHGEPNRKGVSHHRLERRGCGERGRTPLREPRQPDQSGCVGLLDLWFGIVPQFRMCA